MLFNNPDVWEVTLLSIKVSGLATLISLLIGLPFGTLLALSKFPGRSVLLTLINTGMALPPVVVGLAVAMTLWRSGPLGGLHLIYTPAAIIIAQVIIAAPVVTGLTAAALQASTRACACNCWGWAHPACKWCSASGARHACRSWPH